MESGSGFSNFKVKKIRDKAHLKFIRSLPCVRCFQAPSQAAHIRLGGKAGIGQKPCDSKTIPLCPACHFTQHNVGEQSFHGDMDKIHDLAKYLWDNTGKWKECVLKIREYISLNQRRT